MGVRKHKSATVVVGFAAVGLLLAACGSSSSSSSASGGGGAGGSSDPACAPYKAFGDISGKTISIYTGIVAPEDTPQINSYKFFENCTGAKVNYEGNKDFEAQVLVRAKAGNPPDLAIVPQPGLLKQLVCDRQGRGAAARRSAPTSTSSGPRTGSSTAPSNGKFYAAPLGANIKSLVWYSPQMFKDAGLAVPTTLDELKSLSDKIANDGKGIKPWCAGISSGEATGWPVTDWMEDFMLRLSGPETYDKWVNHTIPFNGPESTAALDAVGQYLKNPAYVNGGLRRRQEHRLDDLPGRRPADPAGPVLHAPPGVVLRGQLAGGHQGRP